MKKSVKKAAQATPVIAGRVPAELHQQIQQAAKQSGRSMSGELAWRARKSFEWERALGEFEQAKKTLADIVEGQADAALDRLGWPAVVDPRYGGTVRLPPGRLQMPQSGWVDPEKPSPPLPTPRIIPDPEFARAFEDLTRAVHAFGAALNKRGDK